MSSARPSGDGEVRLHRRPHRGAVVVAGGSLGEERLRHDPGLEELGVRATGQVVEERRRPTEAGRVEVTDDRPAARPTAQRDQALHLEQPESFAEALSGQPELLQHDRF